MALVRICAEEGCSTVLSAHNASNECSLHRTGPQKIYLELRGKIIQADDRYLFTHPHLLREHPPIHVVARDWKNQRMTKRFTEGLLEKLTKKEQQDYEDGRWLGEDEGDVDPGPHDWGLGGEEGTPL